MIYDIYIYIYLSFLLFSILSKTHHTDFGHVSIVFGNKILYSEKFLVLASLPESSSIAAILDSTEGSYFHHQCLELKISLTSTNNVLKDSPFRLSP